MRMVSQAIGRIKVRATRKTELFRRVAAEQMERNETLEFSTDHGWFNRKRGVPWLHGPPRWNRPLEEAIIIVVFPGRQHHRGNSRIAVCVGEQIPAGLGSLVAATGSSLCGGLGKAGRG